MSSNIYSLDRKDQKFSQVAQRYFYPIVNDIFFEHLEYVPVEFVILWPKCSIRPERQRAFNVHKEKFTTKGLKRLVGVVINAFITNVE